MNLNIQMGSRKSLCSQSPQRISAIQLDGITSPSFHNFVTKLIFQNKLSVFFHLIRYYLH